MQAQVYEGYFVEQDRFIPQGKVSIPLNKRAFVTIIDEQPVKESEQAAKPDTWDELFKLTSEMTEDEKPRIEDFPRFDFGRELITFDELE